MVTLWKDVRGQGDWHRETVNNRECPQKGPFAFMNGNQTNELPTAAKRHWEIPVASSNSGTLLKCQLLSPASRLVGSFALGRSSLWLKEDSQTSYGV